MKTCPNCYKDLPDDAEFCTYCGKPLSESKIKERKNEKVKLKKNTRKNNWAMLGLSLLLFGLVVFDFILPTIIDAFGGNTVFPFYISLIMYIISIICGCLSLYIDRKDKKTGYEPNGNKSYAYVCICVSLFIALVNLTQVILK